MGSQHFSLPQGKQSFSVKNELSLIFSLSWDVMSSSLADVYKRSGITFWLQNSTTKMLTKYSSKTVIPIYQETYVVGSKSFRPNQLFKVTEIKQLCYFST